MTRKDTSDIEVRAKENLSRMQEISEKAGDAVNPELWNELLFQKVARHVAKQAVNDPHAEEVSIDTFEDVRDNIDIYYAYRDSFKPCLYESDRRAGSLQRLIRYIELKRELARPGLELSPDSNLRFRQKENGSNPFSETEVVELTVTFVNQKSNLATTSFSHGAMLKQQSLATTLRNIADLVEADATHGNNERVHAEMNTYMDTGHWKTERIMGDRWAAQDVLGGFPQVSESFASKEPGRDPMLIINDPDIPPRELARIYDDIYVTKKVNGVNSRNLFSALKRAREDLSKLTTDDYLAYFWQVAPMMLERDRPPEGYTEKTMGEQLDKYIPTVFETYREQRREEFEQIYLSELQPDKVEASIRKQKGSIKRPPPPSLAQELLGRIAYDTCLENLWFEDGEPFLLRVWSKYREWVFSLGEERADKLKVTISYYDKKTNGAPNLQKIRTNLRKLERGIQQRLGLDSPFRR